MVKQHPKMMLTILRLGDLAIISLAWVVAYQLRLLAGAWGLTPHEPQPFEAALVPMGLSLLVAMLVYDRRALYTPRRTRTLPGDLADMAKAIVLSWAAMYILINLVVPIRPSRIMMVAVLVSWLALGLLGRLVSRSLLRWVRRRGWNLRHAAIVGTGRLGQKLCQALRRNTWMGIEPTYFVSADAHRRQVMGLDVAGPAAQIRELLTRRPVDIIFVALPGDEHPLIERVLEMLSGSNVSVHVVPDLLGHDFLRREVTQIEDLPVVSLTASPQQGWSSLSKRLLDVVLASVGLALAAIPMLAIALVVRLTSPGPVLYRQTRTSLGGKPFDILKFRTMSLDAEQDCGPVWTIPGDPRITPLGRWLRRTSLDELPQLINVLLGHMSMVGPRPERPELIRRCSRQVPRYMLRQHVRAGLTGWAQIHGLRGQSSLRKRVQYDLYYITHWSIALDLRILLLTPFRGLVHPNAY